MTVIGGNTLPRSHDIDSSPAMSERLTDLGELGLGVELGPDSTVEYFGPAEVISDVSLAGLVHISKTPIEKFTQEGVGPNGKFGKGTHFAAGALEGETYSSLVTPGMVLHEAAFTGSVLLVDRKDVSNLYTEMRSRAGLPPSRYKQSTGNADILGLLDQQGTEQPIDAIAVFMDEERTSAEFVVAPRSTENITLTDRKVI